MTNKEQPLTFGGCPSCGSKTCVARQCARGQAPACQRRIVDARNAIVKAGYVCLDCGALFAAGDHDAAQPAPQPSVLEEAALMLESQHTWLTNVAAANLVREMAAKKGEAT